MKLHPPFEVSSRLLPCIRVGKSSFISIETLGVTMDGRTAYRYYIDTPEFEHSADDLKSGCGGGPLQESFITLLSFLGEASSAVAYAKHSPGCGLDEEENSFPENVTAWACDHDGEISMLQIELEENKGLIEGA